MRQWSREEIDSAFEPRQHAEQKNPGDPMGPATDATAVQRSGRETAIVFLRRGVTYGWRRHGSG